MTRHDLLFHQPFAAFLSMGVGHLGGRAAARGCLEGFASRKPWAAADIEAPRLLSTGLKDKVLLDWSDGRAAGADVTAIQTKADALHALCADRTVAILFGSLGDPSAAGLMPALAQHLRGEGLFVIAVASEPFAFENAPVHARAADARPALEAGADLCVTLSAEGLAATLKKGARLREAYRAAEMALMGAAQALMGALAGDGEGETICPQDLTDGLSGHGPLYGGVGFAHGEDAAAAALNAALHPRWWADAGENLAAGNAQLAAAVVGGQEASLAEISTIGACLREGRDPAAPTLLGLGSESSLDDEAHALVLRRAAPSRNVVRLATAGRQE